MKSLAESLFDKDIVSKDLPVFGDHYRVKGVYMVDDNYKNGGMSFKNKDDDYKWLMNTLRLNLLKTKFHTPVKIDNKEAGKKKGFLVGWPAGEECCDILGYLIAAIYTIPYVGKENDGWEWPHPGVRTSDVNKTMYPYFKNMNGDHRVGRGGSFYIAVPSYMGDGVITFEFHRKDMECTIVFEEI